MAWNKCFANGVEIGNQRWNAVPFQQSSILFSSRWQRVQAFIFIYSFLSFFPSFIGIWCRFGFSVGGYHHGYAAAAPAAVVGVHAAPAVTPVVSGYGGYGYGHGGYGVSKVVATPAVYGGYGGYAAHGMFPCIDIITYIWFVIHLKRRG